MAIQRIESVVYGVEDLDLCDVVRQILVKDFAKRIETEAKGSICVMIPAEQRGLANAAEACQYYRDQITPAAAAGPPNL